MNNANPKPKKERTFLWVDDRMANVVRCYAAGADPKKDVPLAEYRLDELPTSIQERLALAGLRTVLQQRASSVDAGPAKIEAMQAVYDHWQATAEWEMTGESGPRNVAPAWLLAAILAAKPAWSPATALRAIESQRVALMPPNACPMWSG